MNPATYGAPPQPYGGGVGMMPQPRPQGIPGPTPYNGVSPGGYGPPGHPKAPMPSHQNGPPPPNQNGPFMRGPSPQQYASPQQQQDHFQKGPMMGQRGPAPDQLAHQMGGMSISQPQQQFPFRPVSPAVGQFSPSDSNQNLNNNYQPAYSTGPPPSRPQGLPPSMPGNNQGPPPPGHIGSPIVGPPSGHTGPPSGHTGPPSGHTGPPSGHTGPPGSLGPSPGHIAPPPGNLGHQAGHPGHPPGHAGPPGSLGPPTGNLGHPIANIGPPGSNAGPPGGNIPPYQAQTGPQQQQYQQSPTPPLSSVNWGPPGQANGPGNAPYGQYPPGGGMQMRYPPAQQNQVPPGTQGQFNQAQQQQQPRMPGGGMGPPQPQQQQGKRLDPDQMPSPIQVIEFDRKSKTGDFFTNAKGQVPPLVTTSFIVHDEGICSPRFMRSTIYSIPCSPDMLKQMAVPFAVSVCPFARIHEKESIPPISNLKDTGPVRCNRCKAYMCAFMQFIDGGRRFQCVFCKGTTEVPPEYFAHLDHMGQRVDKFQRPELCLGSFEYIATKEYCRNGEFPKPPAFIFMIDVSYASYKSGMVSLLCQNLRKILDNLPKDVGQDKSNIRVGFVTYSNVIQFYNVKSNLAQPQMMVVADVNEMFVPLIDGFLVTLEESEAVIDSLLEQIPLMFSQNRETEIVLGPVIQAGLEALKAADCSGKLFIFHSSLPTAEAPGKLKNRDDRKLLGTDKEKTILAPQNTFYNSLGQECVTASCCVDLFLFPNSYIDIATIGQVCKLTGGQVYKYNYFQADIDGNRFLEDLQRDVEKPIAFEAVMRVRTSTGIRPTDFFGNYYMSNTTDVELAAIDCDKALSVEIKYDDKLTEEDGAYIQAATLYTSCGGQRRLRVHNLALNTCNQMADLYRNCELDTVVNFLGKQALRQILDITPRQIKDYLITKGAQILATYRKNCASPSSVGQLILPECMKLLPLYINCLLKNDALAGGSDISVDDRSYAISCLNSMDIINSVGYFYPRLIPLDDLDVNATDIPSALRCSVEKVRETGAYLLENGHYMFIWLGHALSPEWLQDVFSVQSTSRVDPEKPVLLELNTAMSIRIKGIIDQIKNERNRSMKMVIVRQGDKLEIVFRQFLVEDRTGESSVSYVDFLCHLHKEIRNLLT